MRDLELDRLVTRAVFPEVPPSVEYNTTRWVSPCWNRQHLFWLWMVGDTDKFGKARRTHDRASATTGIPSDQVQTEDCARLNAD
ncbi:hypothetical protein [Silvibacterium acidisoli]|uniref:hypothetical protein n=1 Tax=Acidobacteriaceae bacterium ZG23-2 TaxID=2883246 RepID=UPI00406D33EA